MELLVRRFADPRARRLGGTDDRLEALLRQRGQRIEGDLFEGAFHVGQLRLEAGRRFAKQIEFLEEPDDVPADAARRAEVHDFNGHPAADPIETPDSLFHGRWFPRQVEQDEAATELEVAPLAAALGADEDAGPVG